MVSWHHTVVKDKQCSVDHGWHVSLSSCGPTFEALQDDMWKRHRSGTSPENMLMQGEILVLYLCYRQCTSSAFKQEHQVLRESICQQTTDVNFAASEGS